MLNANPWNEARLIRLKECFDANFSARTTAGTLAKEFGFPFSRNAIIGKWNRLGLKRVSVPREPRPARKPKSKTVSHKTATVAVLKPVIKQPAWLGSSFEELTNTSCRFAGEGPPYFFCGAPEADLANERPYCPYHHSICHQEQTNGSL